MLSVSQPNTALNCDPSGGAGDNLTVSHVAIKPNGSFSSTTSQTAVFQGTNAKFTYTFAGAFEGTTPTGPSTVAGIYREDIVPTSGTTTLCTTDDQFWTAIVQS